MEPLHTKNVQNEYSLKFYILKQKSKKYINTLWLRKQNNVSDLYMCFKIGWGLLSNHSSVG